MKDYTLAVLPSKWSTHHFLAYGGVSALIFVRLFYHDYLVESSLPSVAFRLVSFTLIVAGFVWGLVERGFSRILLSQETLPTELLGDFLGKVAALIMTFGLWVSPGLFDGKSVLGTALEVVMVGSLLGVFALYYLNGDSYQRKQLAFKYLAAFTGALVLCLIGYSTCMLF